MKWINTNHALPEGDEVVLALTTGGEYLMLEYIEGPTCHWLDPQTDYEICNVAIACWARLPEPTDLLFAFNQIREM